jgi:hypothetical protein
MTRILIYITILSLTSCSLIPSDEYIDSDTLDINITEKMLVGTYKPTIKTIEQLKRHYSSTDIKKINQSIIRIYANGDSIQTINMPVNSMDTAYFLSTSIDKLDKNTQNEKFLDVRRRNNFFPDIKFRKKEKELSLLVNLGIDPDNLDYYEYKKK